MSRISSLPVGVFGALLALAACSENLNGPSNPPPTATGSVVVSATTTGTDLAEKYVVLIDGLARGSLPANGSLTFADLAPGAHTVALGDVEPNCTATPGASRSVTVVAGTSITATFQVICVTGVGTVRVTTSTVGLVLDPDGYQVALAGREPVAIGPTATVSLTGPSGSFTLTLTGPAVNCAPVGEPVATGRVAAGAIADVRFDLVCFRDPIAFDGLGGVTVIDASGGPSVVMSTPDGRLPDAASGIAWNPSRTRLAYVGSTSGSALDLHVVALNKSERFLLPRVMGEPVLSWSPDGAKIAFLSDNGLGREPEANLIVVNADLSGETQVLAWWPGAYNFSVSWSPDGSRIVYTTYSDSYEGDELWVIEGPGQPISLLGSNPRPIDSNDGAPSWSPDGARIVFQRWYGARSELWVIDADGTNPKLITASDDAQLSSPLWAPDGSTLIFFRNDQLWRTMPDGSSMAPVTTGFALAASWSPSVTFGGPSSGPLRLAISEADWSRDIWINHWVVIIGLDGSGRTVLAAGTNAHWR